MLENLNKIYDEMQEKYGDPSLDSIKNGGYEKSPDFMMVFMNPTKRNIASSKNWQGLKAPWLATKDIWKLFNQIDLFDSSLLKDIVSKKASEWTEEFAARVYDEVFQNKLFITNLGKCTQTDARALKDSVFKEYLHLLLEEVYYVNPKIVITFGNQVSSIILDEKISVSQCRKKSFDLQIRDKSFKVFPVFYPVGNGRFNIDKTIEDLIWIKENHLQ